jgi:hypothetical protein
MSNERLEISPLLTKLRRLGLWVHGLLIKLDEWGNSVLDFLDGADRVHRE